MLAIADRDIKPQNILVDRTSHKVIISDFGSAKQLVKCNF
jgi:serine/threonine protein kinase